MDSGPGCVPSSVGIAVSGDILRCRSRAIRWRIRQTLWFGATGYGNYPEWRVSSGLSNWHQYTIPNDGSATLQSDCNVLRRYLSKLSKAMPHPSSTSVQSNYSVHLQSNEHSCSVHNGFHFQTDGTTNILSRKASTVCGTHDPLVIISKYNSLAFGTTSKHFSGIFSCNVTTIAHREPCDCGWSHNNHVCWRPRIVTHKIHFLLFSFVSFRSTAFPFWAVKLMVALGRTQTPWLL